MNDSLWLLPLQIDKELPSLTLPPITRLQLALYCGGSGDHNPMHVDSDFARNAGFADVFAHGMLSMAFMGKVIARVVPQASVRQFRVRFLALTRVGDQITVRGRVSAADDTMKKFTLKLECVNQSGAKTLEGEVAIQL